MHYILVKPCLLQLLSFASTSLSVLKSFYLSTTGLRAGIGLVLVHSVRQLISTNFNKILTTTLHVSFPDFIAPLPSESFVGRGQSVPDRWECLSRRSEGSLRK